MVVLGKLSFNFGCLNAWCMLTRRNGCRKFFFYFGDLYPIFQSAKPKLYAKISGYVCGSVSVKVHELCIINTRLLQAGGCGSQPAWGSSSATGSASAQQQQQQYVAYPIPGMGGASSHAPPPPPPTTAEAPPTATESGSIQGMY